MKTVTLIVTLLLFVGCAEIKPATVAVVDPDSGKAIAKPVKELTDDEKVELLRTEAHKRKLKWRIVCMDWADADAQDLFLGEVVPSDGAFSIYEEEGSKGMWIEEGHTQATTAYKLYQSILGPQTNPAERKVVEEKKHPRAFKEGETCPPELSGN